MSRRPKQTVIRRVFVDGVLRERAEQRVVYQTSDGRYQVNSFGGGRTDCFVRHSDGAICYDVQVRSIPLRRYSDTVS